MASMMRLLSRCRCKQGVQDDVNCHASLEFTSRNPAVKTTESYVEENANPGAIVRVKRSEPHIEAVCCHSHAEIKVDVDAQMLSHAERGSDWHQM